MTLVDDRGRVGGRINLLDAVVAVLIVILIPVAYGAYLLFRTPPAMLTSVEPTKLWEGPNLRLVVNGKNLRPFMRVSFNTFQGRTFLIGNPKYAQVDLPELKPGAYDVVLYDYMQEVSRLPKALTILPLAPVPNVEMVVTGSFAGLPDALLKLVQPGLKFPPSGEDTIAEVLSVEGSVPAALRIRAGENIINVPMTGASQLKATLRVRCYVASDPDGTLRCLVPGPRLAAPVAPDSNLTLAGPQGWMNFQIADVRAGAK